MEEFLGIQVMDCTQNGTIDWSQGTLTSELSKFPIYTLLFSYASLASVIVIVMFVEAAVFTATRVPPSAVANHRINTVVMMSSFPVFVVSSLPSILVPSSSSFCLTLGDLYFSFVMFKFVVLQVDYYGGHCKMMARLAADRVTFNINVPFLCCFFFLKPHRLTRQSFTMIKMLVLQVIILKPATTFYRAIADFAGVSLSGVPSIVIQTITMASTMTAVTGLNMLNNASSKKYLEKYDMPAKALLMKAGLLMNGFQPTVIMVITWFRPLGCTVPFPSEMLASQWQSFILILESTLLMIPIMRYYRTAEGNVVGIRQPVEHYFEEPTSGMGKMT